jgi:hypothetical protein
VSNSLGGARPSLNQMAASDINSDAAIRSNFSGSERNERKENFDFFVKKILKFTPKNISNIPGAIASFFVVHYKHLQFYPERKCELGMGKTYTQFYRKWSAMKNKLF